MKLGAYLALIGAAAAQDHHHCDERKGEIIAEETGSMDGHVNFVHFSCVKREMCGKSFEHKTDKGVETVDIVCFGPGACSMREGMSWGQETGSMNGVVNFENFSCVKTEDCGKAYDKKLDEGIEHIEIICAPPQPEPHHCDR